MDDTSCKQQVVAAGRAAAQRAVTGEQRDPASGLYYLRARYYDPETGRFLSRDPLEGC
jgi:RHS repeat-associated protein